MIDDATDDPITAADREFAASVAAQFTGVLADLGYPLSYRSIEDSYDAACVASGTEPLFGFVSPGTYVDIRAMSQQRRFTFNTASGFHGMKFNNATVLRDSRIPDRHIRWSMFPPPVPSSPL